MHHPVTFYRRRNGLDQRGTFRIRKSVTHMLTNTFGWSYS